MKNWIQERLRPRESIETDDLDWENVEVHEGHKVTMVFKGPNIATYNLQLFAPETKVDPDNWDGSSPLPHRETDTDKRVLADLPAMLEMMEEALEDLLPEGYCIRITEWNK